jgi:competence protein CoiA
MRYALSNSQRAEATPGAKGVCPVCSAILVARCGTRKVWHWAHKGRKHCDQWWENETEWHRRWKDHFPADWQEVCARDPMGELHIADVMHPGGLVIEFQHSAINRVEVEVRTRFHQNICWVVDGLRLPNSLKQFKRALDDGMRPRSSGAPVYELFLSDCRLLKTWSGLNAPVVFDFGDHGIWIIGRSGDRTAHVYSLPRELIVDQLRLGNRPPPIQPMMPSAGKQIRFLR